MKFISIKTVNESINIDSYNEIISIHDLRDFPEIKLEDNSVIIFEDCKNFYDFIADAELFIPELEDINLNNLIEKCEHESDIVSSDVKYRTESVSVVTKYKFNNSNIYHIQKNGINTLS